MSRGPRVGLGADGRPAGRDADLAAALARYQDAVVRSPHLDPATTELVRLRCARQHGCRICQTLRLSAAIEAGVDESVTAMIDDYERSELPERHKVALRIVDAMIWQPGALSPDLAADAHRLFSDDELAELLVDVTKWSVQKIHVALGTDGTERLELDERGVAYLSFDDSGRPAITPAAPPAAARVIS